MDAGSDDVLSTFDTADVSNCLLFLFLVRLRAFDSVELAGYPVAPATAADADAEDEGPTGT